MLEKIQKSFHEVFGVPEEEITAESTIDNTLDWDSLRHLELITILEKNLEVKFKMSEIVTLNSVQKIIETVESKN